MKVEEIVKERILESLKNGAAPWRSPYVGSTRAINRFSRRGYRGLNLLLIPAGEYGSFAQWHKAGYHPMKGEKSHTAVFWKCYLRREDGADMLPGLDDAEPSAERVTRRYVLRYYNIFERCQVVDADGNHPPALFEAPHQPSVPADDLNVRAIALLHSYMAAEGIAYHTAGGGCAYYSPMTDSITVPEGMRPDDEIQTTAHECVHSTGIKRRLARDMGDGLRESRASYSREELIAETGAGLLTSRMLGVQRADLDNSAAYCAAWARYIAGETANNVVNALSRAIKAVDYIVDKSGLVPACDPQLDDTVNA